MKSDSIIQVRQVLVILSQVILNALRQWNCQIAWRSENRWTRSLTGMVGSSSVSLSRSTSHQLSWRIHFSSHVNIPYNWEVLFLRHTKENATSKWRFFDFFFNLCGIYLSSFFVFRNSCINHLKQNKCRKNCLNHLILYCTLRSTC